jgi:hypothetical protein
LQRRINGDSLASVTSGHAALARRSCRSRIESRQVSPFGWITGVTIRRSLTISGVHEILAVLSERLRQLLDRGWVEQRHSAAGTGQREWRLTDGGRNALSRQG